MAEHWQSRHHRRARERKAVAKALTGKRRPRLPVVVTLTRIGAAFWDDDNWATSAKAFRDEVTKWIGVKNDRDPRIVWAYDQAKARIPITQVVKGRVKKTFRTWCRISIETRNVESVEACHV
jgi:ribosomal protein L18